MSTDILMLIIFALIVVLDIWLYVDEVPDNTFSQRLTLLARKYPSIPLFFGVLMGHFFA